MIIYEVNLTINNEIFKAYYNWLISHIEVMLQYKGFQKAEIAKEKSTEELEKTKLTVRYNIDNEQNLDDYLKNYAITMRDDGIKKFGDKFSAFRRVFENPSVLRPKEKPQCSG